MNRKGFRGLMGLMVLSLGLSGVALVGSAQSEATAMRSTSLEASSDSGGEDPLVRLPSSSADDALPDGLVLRASSSADNELPEGVLKGENDGRVLAGAADAADVPVHLAARENERIFRALPDNPGDARSIKPDAPESLEPPRVHDPAYPVTHWGQGEVPPLPAQPTDLLPRAIDPVRDRLSRS